MDSQAIPHALHCVWGGDQCCVICFCSPFILCVHVAQLLVDRAISYPPELGNMVSLCSKTLQFNTKDKKYLLSVCSLIAASILPSQEVKIGLWGDLGVVQKAEHQLKLQGGLFKTPSVSSSSFCEITGYERCFKRVSWQLNSPDVSCLHCWNSA